MRLSRNIRLLTWFNFFTDFKLYGPVAIIYFTKVTGSFALGMSIFSIAMISSAFFEIPTGIFSDMIGRKKTIVLGAVAAVIYSLFYALGGSFLFLAIGAVFDGLSQAFYSGNNDAFLHDSLSETKNEDRYAEFLGKTSSMFQLALAISAIAGGFMASISFPLVMWLSVLPQVICLSIGLFMSETMKHARESGNVYIHLYEAFRNFITNRRLRLLSLSSILGYGFGEASYLFQSAFYNTIWPIWAIGLAKTLSNLGATVSFRFSGKVIKKIGATRIFILDNVYNRMINIASTAFPTVLSPLLMSTTSILYGVNSVAKSELMQKEFSRNQRATMGSLNSFAGSLFFGIVAFTVGLVADKLAPSKALLMLQFLQFINLFVYIKLFKLAKD